MLAEELEKLISSTQWLPLGSGTYNHSRVSQEPLGIDGYTGYWVFKKAKHKVHARYLAAHERAVRKWNKLNPKYPAYLTKDGWIAPYVGNTPATDEQRASKLIEIYRQTREIVGDAAAKGNNFLVHEDEVICVDVDHAFHRNSAASQQFNAAHLDEYRTFLEECKSSGSPRTVTVICTLMHLEKFLSPEEIKDTYLTQELLNKLYIFYQENEPITVDAIELLNEFIPLDPLGKIPNTHLTPIFLNQMRQLKARKALSLDAVEQLILTQLKRCSIGNIIKKGDLDALILLSTRNKELLTRADSNGWTPLHLAAAYGKNHIVEYLLQVVPESINTRITVKTNPDYSGMSALDIAIYFWFAETANVLFALSPNISRIMKQSKETLFFAVKTDRIELVREILFSKPSLVHATDQFNQTPLLWAACQGHDEILKLLLKYGPDLSALSQYSEDIAYNCLDWAINQGQISTTFILQRAGVKPNARHTQIKGYSVRQLIENGELNYFKLLTAYNSALLTEIDSRGYAPVHYAVLYGKREILLYLRQVGVDLNQPSKEMFPLYEESSIPPSTPLELALNQADLEENEETILFLLQLGVDVPSVTQDNKTHPIHIAVKYGDIKLVRFMMEQHPTLLHAHNELGQTPLLLAETHGHHELVHFFRAQEPGLDNVAFFLSTEGNNLKALNSKRNEPSVVIANLRSKEQANRSLAYRFFRRGLEIEKVYSLEKTEQSGLK